MARVAGAYLTEDQLPAPTDSSTPAREYVNEWITTELLYQEALRRQLVDTDDMRQRLEAAKKRMTIDALLNQELYGDTADITDEAISGYFSAHMDNFVLREDIALLSTILFDDRDAANTFRTRVLRGTLWEDAVRAARSDSLLGTHLLRASGKQFLTQATLYPTELWKVARTLHKETVSFVVSTDAGYYVLHLHDFRRQGEVADLLSVTGEIRDRLMIEARRQMYEDLLRKLRSRFPVEVRLTGHGTPESKDE